jgi:hypothetical protein
MTRLPTTSRETLVALFGNEHVDHTVASVDWYNLGVKITCTCDAKARYVDADRAQAAGLTMVDLRYGLRHAPIKPTQERK